MRSGTEKNMEYEDFYPTLIGKNGTIFGSIVLTN